MDRTQDNRDLTEHLQLALQAGGLGTFRWDMASGATEWDAKLEALFGLGPGEFAGTFDAYVALLHPDDVDSILATVEHAVATKGQYTVEHRTVWTDGSVHWLHGAGQVTLDADGNVTGTIGCVGDVTERMVAEQDRQRLTDDAIEAADYERVSRQRLEFLGQINDALAVSNTRHEVMANVVQATVPHLGDWCSIYVLESPDATIPEIETAHVDPTMVAYARELQQQFPYDPAAPNGMAYVIRTGEAEFYPDITEAVLADRGATDEALEIARNLSLRSAIAVPLIKRNVVLGAMSFIMTASSRRYTEQDLALARVVASRIASSLENRRLTENQLEIATTLQASLLPSSLPDVPGVDIAVRYSAAGEGVEVGGDFYDVLRLTDDRWGVVIGDVCGTGPAAAAITGLARHTIASAAWLGVEPAGVLAHLNRTMVERNIDSFCTAAYATVEPSPEGVVLTLVSGGHPLPVVIRNDATVCGIGHHGTLIGVFDDLDLEVTTTMLEDGDTVVFYTDGATDVPPPYGLSADEFAGLASDAAAAAGSADELADELQRRLAAILAIDRRDDDIALLVLQARRGSASASS